MTKKINLVTFNNSYAQLPKEFYQRVNPIKVPKPTLIALNQQLAKELAINTNYNNIELAEVFSGNLLPNGAEPIAMAYAGHQFGHFVPELGDGRVLLLGEVIDKTGIRWDVQLKGSGLTPFSRRGDGRAVLGPVLREYIVSEAMHALNIPTTRSLAAVTTGEKIQREFLLPGAILTRVARSHVRIGSFEYFKARGDEKSIKTLANYIIARLYPQIKNSDNPYQALLQTVIDAQAKLIAKWMQVGFIHGVMNTDNMALSGETIDYGPCAFIDNYDPMTVFSSIDYQGRYAFNNQPIIALWNLTRFAETILNLLEPKENQAISIAEELLGSFIPVFQEYWLSGMRKKLGLTIKKEQDRELIELLLKLMHENQADFTLTFRGLINVLTSESNDSLLTLFANKEAISNWISLWKERLKEQPESLLEIARQLRKTNPIYIPRNHRIQQMITSAEQGDFLPMQRLAHVLSHPFDDQQGYEEYANPPLDFERVKQTFCGT